MPTITETATIRRDPETLWDEIGAFGSVADWHPLLNSVAVFGEGAGAIRIAYGEEGSAQAERLQVLDPARHLYRYTMEETSMPVRDYTAEFRIDPTGDAASTVVWSAQFELTPDGDGRTVEAVRHFLHAGTENLRRRFE
jgi:Polyketide cyclase / dehydrase and lipid transport